MNKGVAVEFIGTDGKKHYGEYLSENQVAVYARDIKQVPVVSYSDYDVYEGVRDDAKDDWSEHEHVWYYKEVTEIEGIDEVKNCSTYGEIYDALGNDKERFMALLTFAGLKSEFFDLFDNVEPSYDDYEFAWEDFLNCLDECVQGLLKDKTGIVLVMGSNLDWRGRGGYQYLDAKYMSAQNIVNKLAPDTDFSIRVDDDKDGELYFVISHHDCPTGSKMRFIPIERVVNELLSREELLEFLRRYLSDDDNWADERYMYEHVLEMGVPTDDYCVTNVLDTLDKEALGKLLMFLFNQDFVDDSYKDMLVENLK